MATLRFHAEVREDLRTLPAARLTPLLLACGVAAAVLYAFADVLAASLYEGYSYRDQAISELGAIGAPVQPLLTSLLTVQGVLILAFGFGVWRAAAGSAALAVVGGLLSALFVSGLAMPPMHMRGDPASLTDTMHLVVSAVNVLLIVTAMSFSAAALGGRFRVFAVVALVVVLAAGAITGLYAPAVAANEPTPWMGLIERVSIAAWLVWMAVLALVLLRRPQ